MKHSLKSRYGLKNIPLLVKIAAWVLAVAIISFAVLRLVSPYSQFSYNSLFIDSKTHTYVEGGDFKYERYMFNIEISEEKNPPLYTDSFDCAEKPKPSYFTFWKIDPNTWTKEKCIADSRSASELVAAEKKYSVIKYTIVNKSSDLGTVPSGWLTVISKEGKVLFKSSEQVAIAPGAKINREVKNLIDNNAKVASVSIVLPGHAPQIVNVSH